MEEVIENQIYQESSLFLSLQQVITPDMFQVHIINQKPQISNEIQKKEKRAREI